MTVYLVIDPGDYDAPDIVLAVYANQAAAEAHQRSGGSFGSYDDDTPVWQLEIEEMPLLDAFTPLERWN